MQQVSDTDDFFLPDFCERRMIFIVVLLAELFALILVLARNPLDFWVELGLTSLFMAWAGLGCAAVLCRARPLLKRLPDAPATLLAWLLATAVVALLAGLTLWLGKASGVPFTTSPADTFLWRSTAIGAVVAGALLHYLVLRRQWRHRQAAEAEARVQALQARIRPHFLFNSMNTIASLIRSEPGRAEEAVEDLADLFRASLGTGKPLAPLGEELFLCRRYAHLERLRLGERLTVVWQVDGLPDDALIPPLTLQPLLENAVYHGIEPLPEGGTVMVAGRKEGGRLTITLSNPLGGESNHGEGNRIALDNIRERLALHFGDAAGLSAEQSSDGYRVELTIPYRGEAG